MKNLTIRTLSSVPTVWKRTVGKIESVGRIVITIWSGLDFANRWVDGCVNGNFWEQWVARTSSRQPFYLGSPTYSGYVRSQLNRSTRPLYINMSLWYNKRWNCSLRSSFPFLFDIGQRFYYCSYKRRWQGRSFYRLQRHSRKWHLKWNYRGVSSAEPCSSKSCPRKYYIDSVCLLFVRLPSKRLLRTWENYKNPMPRLLFSRKVYRHFEIELTNRHV